jgi:predicted nucleic acid-binding protein
VYDCFYLALAETESATLVTDDTQILALARKAGLSRWVQPLADFAKRKR